MSKIAEEGGREKEEYLNFDIEAFLEEVVEVAGPLVLVLERRDALRGDEEEGTEGWVLHVGRFA